jgi:hypothetical protein
MEITNYYDPAIKPPAVGATITSSFLKSLNACALERKWPPWQAATSFSDGD